MKPITMIEYNLKTSRVQNIKFQIYPLNKYFGKLNIVEILLHFNPKNKRSENSIRSDKF